MRLDLIDAPVALAQGTRRPEFPSATSRSVLGVLVPRPDAIPSAERLVGAIISPEGALDFLSLREILKLRDAS